MNIYSTGTCWLILFFFFPIYAVMGQVDDLDSFFDESPREKTAGSLYNPNILKVNVLSFPGRYVLTGEEFDAAFGWAGIPDISLQYERRIHTELGIEALIGLMPRIPFLTGDSTAKTKWDVTGMISVRNYTFFGILSDRFYAGLALRYQYNNFQLTEAMPIASLLYLTGYQWEPRFTWVVNIETGAGGGIHPVHPEFSGRGIAQFYLRLAFGKSFD